MLPILSLTPKNKKIKKKDVASITKAVCFSTERKT